MDVDILKVRAREMVRVFHRDEKVFQRDEGDFLLKKDILVSWSPPPPDYFKLNSDGVARGAPGTVACGGALRDHMRRWTAGFTQTLL